VTTTTAPTATEWANTLLQTIGYMYGYVDDQGDPINGDARNFVVMVGTASLYAGLVQAIGLNSLASAVRTTPCARCRGSTSRRCSTRAARRRQRVRHLPHGWQRQAVHPLRRKSRS
jgi:hypothetical protein